MTMEFKVSFTFSNTTMHSESEVANEIIEKLSENSLTEIDDLKVDNVG